MRRFQTNVRVMTTPHASGVKQKAEILVESFQRLIVSCSQQSYHSTLNLGQEGFLFTDPFVANPQECSRLHWFLFLG
jgi:hypothetical protein